MPISMVGVVREVRKLVAEITGIRAVYAASETDANGLPNALNAFPCAVVLPGGDAGDGYILSSGTHRHTYEIEVQIFEGSGDLIKRSSTMLPIVDRLIEALVGNVLLEGSPLGALVTYCLFRRQTGFQALEYGGGTYLGYAVTLEVSEQAAATPATGS